MAASRIPDLTSLTGAGSTSSDLLVIFDADADTTKKITRAQLAAGLQGDLAAYPTTGTIATQNANNVAITGGTLSGISVTSGTITGITDLAVADGGTGASDAAGARSNLGAAASGANSDITSLTGLTTPLSVAQGGTGSGTASGARSNLSAAASGVNSDITELTGLTTPLSVAQGGTGQTTLAGFLTALGALGVDSSALTANGYIKFTNSLYILWGTGSVSNNSTATVTFPSAQVMTTFSRVVVSGGEGGSGATENNPYVTACTTTGFSVFNPRNAVITFFWIGVGF